MLCQVTYQLQYLNHVDFDRIRRPEDIIRFWTALF